MGKRTMETFAVRNFPVVSGAAAPGVQRGERQRGALCGAERPGTRAQRGPDTQHAADKGPLFRAGEGLT